jgi:hypothetical protein
VIGLRSIPTERDLRFLWEEMPQQQLDEQSQKVQQSLRAALISWQKPWAKPKTTATTFPPSVSIRWDHWYEIPNLFLNGTLHSLILANPNLKHLMVHNIDTLGANADPVLLGYHIRQQSGMTAEVITRRLDDRGGGLARINGQLRLVEGMALPDEKIEFNLSYYSTKPFWIDIDKLLTAFGLSRSDLGNPKKVETQVFRLAARIPTYVIIRR